jgi:hypothetical protein
MADQSLVLTVNLRGLDVRTMSGRRRDMFLDILFIEFA